MEKSDNPLIAELQDMILEKYGFDSCVLEDEDDEAIGVGCMSEYFYYIYIFIRQSELVINESWRISENIKISLYDENILDKVFSCMDNFSAYLETLDIPE